MPDVKFMADLLFKLGYVNSPKLYYDNPSPHIKKHIEKLYWDVQSRGEFDWYFSCKNKMAYGTAWEATKAAYRQSEWRKRDYDPYICRFCGKYHVGRTVENREERKRFYEKQVRKVRNALSQR
jgi:hypothetical protein